MDKDGIILELLARLGMLEERLDKLEKENMSLREQLVSKTSRNSSIPPSTEIAPPKCTKSLRKPTGRRPGGQPGHKGSNLKMVSNPDVVDKRIPEYCRACGSDLSDTPAQLVGKRQLIDIPPIIPVVTEQQIYERTRTCGHTAQGAFSANANAPVGYGENIEGLVAYLHARQYVPVSRMKEIFNDILGTPISTGGICHLLDRFANKVTPLHRLIRDKLSEGRYVGSDEAGCKVNVKLHWFWTWQSPQLTYITHSPNRGHSTIADHFPKGFPNSTLVHDAWRPHLNTVARTHQLCLAHLIRELNYLMQLYSDDKWTRDLSALLHRALALSSKMGNDPYYQAEKERDLIMDEFKGLLLKPPEREHKKAYTLFKRMLKNEEYILTFLFDTAVPSDNNASERAIRNIKVK